MPRPMNQKSKVLIMLRLIHLFLTQELRTHKLSALMWSRSRVRKKKHTSKKWPSHWPKGVHGIRAGKTKVGRAKVRAESLGKTGMAGKAGRAARMERVPRARKVGKRARPVSQNDDS